jgi:MFS family permease
MEGLVHLFKKQRSLTFVYAAMLFLSFHYFTTVFINAPYLSLYFSQETFGLFYAIGSAISIAIIMFLTPLLRRFGDDRLLIFFALVELLITLGIAFIPEPRALAVLFILFQALPLIILYTLDIFLEGIPHKENSTGRIRGIYQTVSNFTLVFAPLIVSATVVGTDYSLTYFLSALFLIPIFILALSKPLRTFKDPVYRPLHIASTLKKYLRTPDLRNIFITDLLLQIFYAWMVIYTPILLLNLGLSWQSIGLIFTFMLLPFLLFEIPIGKLADTKYGEKEFMVAGFIVMCIATGAMSLVGSASLFAWGAVLFLTRTGAAAVEITNESYFFKKVRGQDSDLISIFRMARPVSFIIGPLIGAPIIATFGLQNAFMVFAIILSLGTIFALALNDTR